MKVLFSGKVNLLHQEQHNIVQSIENLYKKMGVDFIVVDEEVKCGEASMNLGLVEDAEKVVKKFKEQVDRVKPDIIVSPYAAGVAKYRKEVPERYGINLGVPYVHLSQFLFEHISKNRNKLKSFPHKYFIHHGCTLGRKISEFHYVRELLELVPDMELLEEGHPSAEIEGRDVAEYNTCPGSWLNMTQPELSEYIKENYVLEVLIPTAPEYAGSSCANGHYGISQGLEIAEVENIKPLYFSELFNNIWRS
ncbi:MAG: (Fe-S)-binding protein [Acidobacteriota bacterium]